MPKFFNFILRQKKIVLLLSFFILISVPQITHALATTDSILTVTFLAIPFLTMSMWWGIARFSATVLGQVIILVMSRTITTDPVFLTAWNMVKNWANMLIVVAFIGIAVATILRFREYEAKKLLAPLLIVALLVNFSIVFVGGMIDISNIIMVNLLGRTNVQSGELLMINELQRIERTVVADRITALLGGGAISAYPTLFARIFEIITNMATFAVLYMGIAISYFALAIILLVRFAVLAVLFILSPLAFVFRVFPLEASKKLWNEWWQKFLKWCFIGVGGIFFVKLSTDIFMGLVDAGRFRTMNDAIFTAIITIIILVIGLRVTVKAAPFGSALLMGAAGGITGFALGKLATVTGAQRVGSNLKEAATRAREYLPTFLGGVPVGSANLQRQDRFKLDDKSKKALDAATPAQIKKLARGYAYTPEAIAQKTYAIQKMAEKGDMKGMPIEEKEKLAGYAIAGGVSPDVFTKTDPRLAKLNLPKLNEEKRKLIGKESGLIDPVTGVNRKYMEHDMTNKKSALYQDMEHFAGQAVDGSAYRKLTVADIREKLDVDAINMNFINNTTAKRITEASKDLSADKKAAIKGLEAEIIREGGILVTAITNAAKAGNTALENELRAKASDLSDKLVVVQGL